MRCKFCKKEDNMIELFEGIYESGMIRVCRSCSEIEGVPLIRKPTVEQLKKADVKYSVRERMERLSGPRDTTELSNDQIIVQKNLGKLKAPEKKEFNENVLDNYYWELNMARRRRKMSIKQLSEAVGVSAEIIEKIEQGKIPENFEEIFLKLESYFKINLLKIHTPRLKFSRTLDEETKILEEVRKKIGSGKSKEEENGDILNDISEGKIDFSRREELEKITLSALMDRKRKREELEAKRSARLQTDSMLGDEIDLDEI